MKEVILLAACGANEVLPQVRAVQYAQWQLLYSLQCQMYRITPTFPGPLGSHQEDCALHDCKQIPPCCTASPTASTNQPYGTVLHDVPPAEPRAARGRVHGVPDHPHQGGTALVLLSLPVAP